MSVRAFLHLLAIVALTTAAVVTWVTGPMVAAALFAFGDLCMIFLFRRLFPTATE